MKLLRVTPLIFNCFFSDNLVQFLLWSIHIDTFVDYHDFDGIGRR